MALRRRKQCQIYDWLTLTAFQSWQQSYWHRASQWKCKILQRLRLLGWFLPQNQPHAYSYLTIYGPLIDARSPDPWLRCCISRRACACISSALEINLPLEYLCFANISQWLARNYKSSVLRKEKVTPPPCPMSTPCALQSSTTHKLAKKKKSQETSPLSLSLHVIALKLKTK